MAKRSVESIVSGAGMFQSLITLLVEKVKELGGGIEDIYRLITPEGAETLKKVCKVMVDEGRQSRNLITRIVTVDRSRTPQQVLDATDRRQDTAKDVVATMPVGGTDTEEVTVEFFKLDRYVSDKELALEFEKRGLTPDPYAVAKVNEVDQAFADDYPNSTHWYVDGCWHCINFSRGLRDRRVCVDRSEIGWGVCWWFGGVSN